MCRDGKRYEGAVQDQSYVDVDESKEDVIGDDDILTDESTLYNEWLAAQGLVGLSEDQPSHGDIRKFHTKASGEASADNITKTESDEKVTIDIVKEEKTIANDNSQVVEDKEKSPEKIKISDYVRSKMKISKAKETLLLKGNKKQTKKEHCYNKQKYTAKSSVPIEEVKKENEGEKSGLTQMEVLQKTS